MRKCWIIVKESVSQREQKKERERERNIFSYFFNHIINCIFLYLIYIFISYINLIALFSLGKSDMILMAILEFVEICLVDNNVPQARRLLNDAEVVLQQVR